LGKYDRFMNTIEIQKKLSNIGDILARILDPSHVQTDLVLEVIKRSEISTSIKAKLGDTVGFLKLFHEGENATDAFDRERRALELLMGEQVPKLLFVAEAEHVIMTSFIKGKSVLGTLSSNNVNQVSEHMGQWFGRLANKAPKTNYEGDWASYMDLYSSGFETDILDNQRPILEQSRIANLTLSHNDNALGNFIMGADKRLYAVDFEDSRMKPEGWDLITAGRALFGQMPRELPIISGSLLRGYQLTAKDCNLPDNFDQVISAVAFANAAKAA
jgi:tRNA A-37 threonylcarbamoyl transferase component Bud32